MRESEHLAKGSSKAVETMRGVVVDSLARRNGKTEVTLRHDDGRTSSLTVDWILSLTGSVGDHSIYRQLQVHECYATSGPMKLAAALLGSASADCLDQGSQGVETLVNPEPNFFILGGVLLATLLLRRAFCGYVCPIGAISEGVGAVASRLRIPRIDVPRRLDRGLAVLGFAVLGIILWFTWKTSVASHPDWAFSR